jgi:hypothetical protein
VPLIFIFCFLNLFTWANEVNLSSQQVYLKKQKQNGHEQDIRANVKVKPDVHFGLEARYLERFSFFEKSFGLNFKFSPFSGLTLIARRNQGLKTTIIPRESTSLEGYYSLSAGFSPYLIAKKNIYSLTTTDMMIMGIEIEKYPRLIVIPTILLGQAQSNSPSSTKAISGYGIKIIYYEENQFSTSVFFSRGKEPSQGILGDSFNLISTETLGLSLAKDLISDYFRMELVLNQTHYQEIKNQFIAGTINLTWMFK